MAQVCNTYYPDDLSRYFSGHLVSGSSYTSASGNTYWKDTLKTKRVEVEFDKGQGYMHTFLNGIRVYGYDGYDRCLLAQRLFDCHFYNHNDAVKQAEELVCDYLQSQIMMSGRYVSESEIRLIAHQIISESID